MEHWIWENIPFLDKFQIPSKEEIAEQIWIISKIWVGFQKQAISKNSSHVYFTTVGTISHLLNHADKLRESPVELIEYRVDELSSEFIIR